MNNYLILHIDLEFIAGIVYTSNGKFYPINNTNEELLWMYFYNDPNLNKITFGKENKLHFNNSEMNYYGNLFNHVIDDNLKFNIRGINRPVIDLLEESNLLKLLKENYKKFSKESGNEIPTLITFSSSISNSTKQRIIDYFSSKEFVIISYTIPLAELICCYYLKENKIKANNGKYVIFLKATNTTLHISKLNYTDGYLIKDENSDVSHKAMGYDPRKKALVKFVVNEVNKATGLLSSNEEIEDECFRLEYQSEQWLKQLDAASNNLQIYIRSVSFSNAPNIRKDVIIRKNDIECDTGYYIQDLIDVYNSFEKDNIGEENSIAAVILFGDCFNNSLIKSKFETQIDKEKLLITNTNSLLEILSVYPTIDLNRYANIEERIKEQAKIENYTLIQQKELEEKQKEEKEKELIKQEEIKKSQKNKQKANQLFELAKSLDKEDKLLDAISNIENAKLLDPENNEIISLFDVLKDKKTEIDFKTKQYKVLLTEADNLMKNGKLGEALYKYELARTIFDTAEIRNTILEVKDKNREQKEREESVNQLFENAEVLFKNKRLIEAKKILKQLLEIDLEHNEAKEILKAIDKTQHDIESQYKILINEAEKNMNESRFDATISIYNEALKIRPNDEYCVKMLKFVTEKKASNKPPIPPLPVPTKPLSIKPDSSLTYVKQPPPVPTKSKSSQSTNDDTKRNGVPPPPPINVPKPSNVGRVVPPPPPLKKK